MACSNKTLFTKTGSSPSLALGLYEQSLASAPPLWIAPHSIQVSQSGCTVMYSVPFYREFRSFPSLTFQTMLQVSRPDPWGTCSWRLHSSHWECWVMQDVFLKCYQVQVAFYFILFFIYLFFSGSIFNAWSTPLDCKHIKGSIVPNLLFSEQN